MSMTKGHVIQISDIKEAIDNYVATQIAGYKEGQFQQYTIQKKELTENINSAYNDAAAEHHDTYKKGGTIKIADVKDIMIKSMHQACRLCKITYKVYASAGYLNDPTYHGHLFPQTYKGINRNVNVELDEYKTEFENKFPEQGEIIEALRLTEILEEMVEYNKAHQHNKNFENPLNTCYFSCHASCHGSSRSRR